MSDVHFTCPVCGFAGLTEPHVDPVGSPTYSICPCCGTHFGADDVEKTHAELRHDWIVGGLGWWSQNEHAPADWDGRKQLEVAGHAADLVGAAPN